jgi:hypothetical protein
MIACRQQAIEKEERIITIIMTVALPFFLEEGGDSGPSHPLDGRERTRNISPSASTLLFAHRIYSGAHSL